MFLSVIEVHSNLFGCVGRIIDFEAVNGHFLAEFIKQPGIITGVSLAASRMGKEQDCSTTMSGITGFSNVASSPGETGIRDQCSCGWFSCPVAQFFQKSHQFMRLLCARFCQEDIEFMWIWKGDPGFLQVLPNLSGVFLLTACDILRQILQRTFFWIKPITKHIGGLAFPRCTYLHSDKERELLLQREMLQRYGSVRAIMIGDRRQAKLLARQIINQLFGGPCAITVDSVHLQINSSINRQNQLRSR